MSYTPEHQYRCTIIRGKSQTDMEDLLPLYANMVHKVCPCEESVFKASCYRMLSKALFSTTSYDTLPKGNKKTVQNHLSEIAGILLGLYYIRYDGDIVYVCESDSCKYLVDHNDYPVFFQNLCLNFQFPNGAKWMQYVKEDINNKIHIKPFCYIVELLYYAQNQSEKKLLTQQEIGYYVLNNLDVLQGNVSCKEVYDRIMLDRQQKIGRNKLQGSYNWQHIREQFNLLELANIIKTDATYIWLNREERNVIAIFLANGGTFTFDPYKYNLNSKQERKIYLEDWKFSYGKFNMELLNTTYPIPTNIVIYGRDGQKACGGATKSTVDLGDEGENLVFYLEQERVRKYKERLINKVLLLGKTKGLGYDIASVEADENVNHPEFARYIEVKSTRRMTEPDFGTDGWSDALNLTAKEWVAAEQYQEYYNIYRVYFLIKSNKTIVVRIQNPFKKAEEGKIEVYPTTYQMSFDSRVIEKCYDE
ncbi:MAG: DUF3883 domain-containing protein [Paludibacteraceae bacterium]|nr:DUF3883 domain-containing protein [Paludibacteraceae bacterium]